tara:strand:- start:31 stop:195 length:165 start_codon:yes stop_codon:yes gene_type:complete
MIKKILIGLLIGFVGFIIWITVSLWFIEQGWILLIWTVLVLLAIWVLTKKILQN